MSSIKTIIEILAAGMTRREDNDVESESKQLCTDLVKHCQDSYGNLKEYTHAFLCQGWGGRSQCRNVLLQLLFGSSNKDTWILFFGRGGIGVIDTNDNYHHYDTEIIKKINANGADGSMIRVYMKGERYLELRFTESFAGEGPNRLLNSVVLDKKC
jgi:hypothetical protein